jgi:hypothetical protein
MPKNFLESLPNYIMDEQCMNFIHNDDGHDVDHDVGDVICDNGKQQGFPRSMVCKALLV